MDITPTIPSDRQVIDSYGPGRFQVAGVGFDGPIIVLPSETMDWTVSHHDALAVGSLAPLLSIDPMPEVVLLGIGSRMQLLPRDIRDHLKSMPFAVDVMDTGAACRTYNILLSEGRRVAAALIPVATDTGNGAVTPNGSS